MQCGFCNDQCCSHGVDVDFRALSEIQRHAEALEGFTGIPRHEWFASEIERDETFPGGGAVRTRVRDGRCVFLNRTGRGCGIHAYCLDRGLDYHDLKPLVDCLFPVTYEDGTLVSSEEVDDDTLICLDTGPTLYRGARPELAYYFGEALVEALDAIEASLNGGPRPEPGRGS
jgi:hypothetical protein